MEIFIITGSHKTEIRIKKIKMCIISGFIDGRFNFNMSI